MTGGKFKKVSIALGADRKWGPSGGRVSFKTFICLFVYLYVFVGGVSFLWRLEENLKESVLSFHSGAHGWKRLVRV